MLPFTNFPLPSALGPPGQLAWPGSDLGAPGGSGFNGMMGGQSGAHLMGSQAQQGAAGLGSLPPHAMVVGANTPTHTLSGSQQSMASSQQQQQQQQQLALAAAMSIMSQMGQAPGGFNMMPPPGQGMAMSDPGSNSFNPLALLLAQQAAAAMQGGLAPYLGAMPQLAALQAQFDPGAHEQLAAAPWLQQPGVGEGGFGGPHMQQQHKGMEGVDPEPTTSDLHRSQSRDAHTPSTSSPSEQQVETASGEHKRRAAPGGVPGAKRQQHSTQPASTAPVLDSALVEHSQRGTSEELSSASGCSQPAPHLAQLPSKQRRSQVTGSQQQHASQAAGNSTVQHGMPPPPPRITQTGGSARTGTTVASAGARKDPGGLQARMKAALGEQQWERVRATLLKQQATFVQQLYELHKLDSVQRLLCMEVFGCDYLAASAAGSHQGGGKGGGAGGSGGKVLGGVGEGSCMSLPSVSAPVRGKQPKSSRGAGGGGSAAGDGRSQQRVQQDLMQLANIPGHLRKAATSMTADATRSKGPSSIALPQAGGPASAARPPAGVQVLRPTPTRKGHNANDTATVQKPAAASPVSGSQGHASVGGGAPVGSLAAAPAGGGLLEAATALLQSAGGGLPALPGLTGHHSTSRAATSNKGGCHDTAIGSGAPSVGAPPLLMPGPAAFGFLPPAPVLNTNLNGPAQVAAGAMLDPHTAWFSKNFTGATSSQPAAIGGSISTGAAGGEPAPSRDEGGRHPYAPPPLQAPVRWWQDEAATFGDVAPSLVTPQISDSGATKQQVTSGNKRPMKQVSNAQLNGAAKRPRDALDGRMDGYYGDDPAGNRQPSAFQVVRPRKARSKRGSNRLGPGNTAHDPSLVSDDSNDNASMHQEGSCVMGSSVAARPMASCGGSGNIHGTGRTRVSTPGGAKGPSAPMGSPTNHHGVPPSRADKEAPSSRRPSMNGYGNGANRYSNGAHHDHGGWGAHHMAAAHQPAASEHDPPASNHSSEEKDQSAADLLLSLSCGSGHMHTTGKGSSRLGHDSREQHGQAMSVSA